MIVDEPDRMAAVISGPVILHQYLLADPVNSTITELALWSDAPPQTPWPVITDTAVLDALAAPLCTRLHRLLPLAAGRSRARTVRRRQRSPSGPGSCHT